MMERLNVYKTRFLAERNFYLFSFTLALFLCVSRRFLALVGINFVPFIRIILRVEDILQNYNRLKAKISKLEKAHLETLSRTHAVETDTFRVGSVHPSDVDPLVSDIQEVQPAESRRRD